MREVVVDAASGASLERVFSDAEQAAVLARWAVEARALADSERLRARLAAARPERAVFLQAADGLDLAPAELQRAVRYLLLLAEQRGGGSAD